MKRKDTEYRERIKELQRKYNEELQQLHQELAAKEKQYLKEVNDLRQQLVNQEKRHQEATRIANEKYAYDMLELNKKAEAMRLEKDTIIENMTIEIEQMRSTYELRLDEMNIENKNLETQNAN